MRLIEVPTINTILLLLKPYPRWLHISYITLSPRRDFFNGQQTNCRPPQTKRHPKVAKAHTCAHDNIISSSRLLSHIASINADHHKNT